MEANFWSRPLIPTTREDNRSTGTTASVFANLSLDKPRSSSREAGIRVPTFWCFQPQGALPTPIWRRLEKASRAMHRTRKIRKTDSRPTLQPVSSFQPPTEFVMLCHPLFPSVQPSGNVVHDQPHLKAGVLLLANLRGGEWSNSSGSTSLDTGGLELEGVRLQSAMAHSNQKVHVAQYAVPFNNPLCWRTLSFPSLFQT